MVLGVGASAGGADAVRALAVALAAGRAPMLISQHMPPGTSEATLELLSRGVSRRMELAASGTRLRPSVAYVCPAGHDLGIDDRDAWARIAVTAPAANDPRVGEVPRPNVDAMLEEMARAFGPRCCAVILSGMGHDGLVGAAAIKATGGRVAVQDRASSSVWGMPARIVDAGLADHVGDVASIAAWVLAEERTAHASLFATG